MIKNATAAPNVRQQPQEELCRSVVCVCACVFCLWYGPIPRSLQ